MGHCITPVTSHLCMCVCVCVCVLNSVMIIIIVVRMSPVIKIPWCSLLVNNVFCTVKVKDIVLAHITSHIK